MSDKFELGPKQRKWIEALRSGEYEQGKGSLCRDGKFCCLGVANAVLGLGETHEQRLESTFDELGLIGPTGEILGGADAYDWCDIGELVELNDSGWTFEQIADILEQYPEQYFTKSV